MCTPKATRKGLSCDDRPDRRKGVPPYRYGSGVREPPRVASVQTRKKLNFFISTHGTTFPSRLSRGCLYPGARSICGECNAEPGRPPFSAPDPLRNSYRDELAF
jgi:hypothetical protein